MYERPIVFDEICLTGATATVAEVMGFSAPAESAAPIKPIVKKAENIFSGRKADRALLYNPDAVALWLYQKYTDLFTDAAVVSDIAIPLQSVMPSVTPVCFASMYSGILPEKHGIQSYTKPVLQCELLFDCALAAGKKVAIVSTAEDSISMIFLEREMDYFIYDDHYKVNEKALELMKEDKHDIIVVYNGNYDSTMHGHGPEAPESIEALKENVATYKRFAEAVKEDWKGHDVIYGFMPDHGCHETRSGRGSHGHEVEEDMNIIHFYGFSAKGSK